MRNSVFGPVAAVLLGVYLVGCGGGGDSSSPPPSSGNPPPVTPPVTPPVGTTVPPQAATAIDLDDNHDVGAFHWEDGNTSDGASGEPMQGLTCDVNMDETYHVHTHLSIFLNGEALQVPGDIGVVRTSTPGVRCFYAIHTHDQSGKIHVEAPAPGVFTLGQLFAIWGQNLSSTDVAGFTGMPVTVYTTDDGVVSVATGDWHDIELASHREITIQIGTAITEIPNFTWSAH
jgi:hypothetical protein